jgi:electron transport complex protein RnfD
MPDIHRLIVSQAPHIHSTESVPRIMGQVLLALLPACAAALWFFGMHALRVLFLCTAGCVAVEILWMAAARRPLDSWKDGSAAVTGVLLGMNLSAGAPWWICLLGALLAIGLGKQIFGGLGYNPFNPALVARVGLLVGFPQIMTSWVAPQPGAMLSGLDAVSGATPLAMSTADIAQQPAMLQALFTGNTGGCLGETSFLALLLGGVFLLARRLILWEVPAAFIGTVAIITGLAHHVTPEATPSALHHVMSGGLMIGAFFMATDMVTSPMTRRGALIFGAGCGLITSVIRLWGSYPEGVSFAILFMNALTPLIDRYTTGRPFGFMRQRATEGRP